ncbi:MAG: hypothetical protein R3B49_08180 [Phycisphaerales bacterium]
MGAVARMSACVVIGAALAGGCTDQPTARPDTTAIDPGVAPVLRGGASVPESARGVEIRIIPVLDRGGAIGAALAPYEGVPVGADPVLLYRWREAGLRLIAVPERELDKALAPLRPARLVEASWWAEMPNWRPVFGGPWFERLAVDTGGGVRTLGAGRVRLLARAWFEPTIRDGSIVTSARSNWSHSTRPRGTGRLADLASSGERGGAGEAAWRGDEGEAFETLSLGFSAPGEDAYIIVGESPDVDWRDGRSARGGRADAVRPSARGVCIRWARRRCSTRRCTSPRPRKRASRRACPSPRG